MLYYKDIITGKRRRTFGRPIGIARGGLANCLGLIVANRASEMFIPEYLLQGMGASEACFNDFKAKMESETALDSSFKVR